MRHQMTLVLTALLACVFVSPVAGQSKSAGSKKPTQAKAKASRSKPKPLDARQTKQVKALLRELFKASDESQRMAAREKLGQLAPLGRRDAAKLIKYSFRLATVGFRIPRGSMFQIPIGDVKGTVHVSGSGGRRKGLWIGLHGGGRGIGDGKNSQSKWQSAVSAGCVCLFPTVLPNKTWSDPVASTYINKLIEAAKRTWGIDTNRVYLSGHSMGGFGTWQNGSHSADRFAAIAEGAGGGYGKGVPRNLFNTPIYFFHSTDDARVPPASDQANAKELAELKKAHPKGYEHVYKEYSNIGHGLPRKGLGPIIKWAARHRRNPYPKKVIWQARDAMNKQFFWLYSDRPQRHGVIVAEWQKDNLLRIKCGSSEGLTILLSPKLVNFSKPLTILVNGQKRFEGFAPYTAWACGVSVRRRNDSRQFFVGHLRLSGATESDDDDD